MTTEYSRFSWKTRVGFRRIDTSFSWMGNVSYSYQQQGYTESRALRSTILQSFLLDNVLVIQTKKYDFVES